VKDGNKNKSIRGNRSRLTDSVPTHDTVFLQDDDDAAAAGRATTSDKKHWQAANARTTHSINILVVIILRRTLSVELYATVRSSAAGSVNNTSSEAITPSRIKLFGGEKLDDDH